MQNFHLPCISCHNQLSECGSLLSTLTMGPLVSCEICRTLYFVEVTNIANKPIIVIRPTNFDPEIEFEIIRYAESRVPLSEYLKPLEENKQKIINPHFDQDIKKIIDSSTTPSDFIKKLNGN